MTRQTENTSFTCEVCKEVISPLDNGSYRNHCPFCLSSKHVDHTPGDRQSTCLGTMKAIAVDYSGAKGFIIIHQCQRCKKISRNKAAQSHVQPDSLDQLLHLMNNGIREF